METLLGSCAESVWHHSSAELVPEAVAWILCVSAAANIARHVVRFFPLACILSVGSWISWLFWQSIYTDLDVLKDQKDRGTEAFGATKKFMRGAVALVAAWLDLLLPFLTDAFTLIQSVWAEMTFNQRLWFAFFAFTMYAVFEALRLFRRHERTLHKVLFHVSFIGVGPTIWYACGHIPAEWLPLFLRQILTTLPTFVSFKVLSSAFSDEFAPSQANPRTHIRERSVSFIAAAPTTNHGMLKLCLSYWSCWPMLSLLVAASRRLPKLSGNLVDIPQDELQRALIVFVVWLQVWQGSRLLLFTMKTLLLHSSMWDHVAQLFTSLLGPILSSLSGFRGISAALRFCSWAREKASNLRFLQFLGLLCVLAVVVLLYVFYQTLVLVGSAATVAIWCFSAVDSADVLINGEQHLYSRKLAFWVGAMLSDVLTELPVVGGPMRLVTPMMFPLWHLAGDHMIRWVVLPVCRRIEAISLGFAMCFRPLVSAGILLGLFGKSSATSSVATDSSPGGEPAPEPSPRPRRGDRPSFDEASNAAEANSSGEKESEKADKVAAPNEAEAQEEDLSKPSMVDAAGESSSQQPPLPSDTTNESSSKRKVGRVSKGGKKR